MIVAEPPPTVIMPESLSPSSLVQERRNAL